MFSIRLKGENVDNFVGKWWFPRGIPRKTRKKRTPVRFTWSWIMSCTKFLSPCARSKIWGKQRIFGNSGQVHDQLSTDLSTLCGKNYVNSNDLHKSDLSTSTCGRCEFLPMSFSTIHICLFHNNRFAPARKPVLFLLHTYYLESLPVHVHNHRRSTERSMDAAVFATETALSCKVDRAKTAYASEWIAKADQGLWTWIRQGFPEWSWMKRKNKPASGQGTGWLWLWYRKIWICKTVSCTIIYRRNSFRKSQQNRGWIVLDLNFYFPYNNGECSLNEIFRKKFRMKYRIPFAVRTGREKKWSEEVFRLWEKVQWPSSRITLRSSESMASVQEWPPSPGEKSWLPEELREELSLPFDRHYTSRINGVVWRRPHFFIRETVFTNWSLLNETLSIHQKEHWVSWDLRYRKAPCEQISGHVCQEERTGSQQDRNQCVKENRKQCRETQDDPPAAGSIPSSYIRNQTGERFRCRGPQNCGRTFISGNRKSISSSAAAAWSANRFLTGRSIVECYLW